MKTPQEEAEKISKRIATKLFGGQPNSAIGHRIVADEAKEIRESTALPELIAVARAANEVGKYVFMEGGSVRHEEIRKMKLSLQALRATGKVEL